ncbi:filamentous hemagglutinin N-terminal domain-containing protein [Neisseria meningitidis]|uniref:two-partner secretion domain-containing protein n=2 Tax=Neisseria meningitidis TaxID=487 RepID=UPI001C597B97|nr:hemagglutinin repeat-containing protein [Neisseria meningitidis]MBW3918931.1 filamentous hemagglutinin N-terminal domain-containing protein [Neisseria meningitidis]
MNKTLYRVIFNRKRGAVVAVAETTKREGKSCADSDSGSAHVKSVPFGTTHAPVCRSNIFSFSLLGFSLCLAVGTANIAFADGIIADKAAPKTQQATILQTGNGIPQVNIQTPTSAGVSVNQYTQFDVGNRGAILNNSRSNTKTQLGGWIQGNPWLARGEARVVVNQINSSHSSQLNGYIEVGGRRAEVVIANPAGIAVNGGGFINASRATLTTGQPQYQAGDLSGFKIRQGNVAITGQGLDARDTDYTRILSYHSKIDVPVWGQDVRVVAGQNDVASTGDAHSPILNNAAANTSNNTANNGTHIPLFAIDTGKLGGMYANKITLISTAEQAGIRNQGQLFASSGNVAIDANGRLVNSGTMAAANAKDTDNTAEHKVNIRSQGVENSGTAVSQQGTQIHSQSIQNTGTLLSSGEILIHNSGSLKNETSGTIEAARLAIDTDTLNNQGKLSQTGSQKLHIDAQGKMDNRGRMGLQDTAPTASNGSSNQTGNSYNASSHSSTTTPTTATGTGTATVSISNITAPTFADGTIRTHGALDNSGSIIANGQTDVSAQQGLNNAGQIDIHQLNAKGSAFDNHNGTIISDAVHIQAGSLNNQNGNITTRQQLEIETGQLDNAHGKLLSAEIADLAVSGSLNNQNGEIATNQQLIIHDGQQSSAVIDNTNGTIQSGHDVAIQAKSLSNNGTLAADNKLDIALQDDFYVGRKIVAGNELSLSTRGSLKNSHTLQAGKRIQIKANNLDNAAQGNIQSGGTTDIGTQHNLTNRGLIDGQQTKIQAGQVNNIGTGRIYGDNIAIAATRLDNQDENGTGAAIAARENLNLGIGQLNNRENSLIYSGNDMAVGGALDTNGQATGKAQSIRNAGATIEAAGKMRLGVEKLHNTNEHLKTQLVETGREHIVDYEAFGRHELLREGTQHELGWFVYNNESDHLRTPDGVAHENWHKYDYEKVTQETQVTGTAPAKIIAGSDLIIDSKAVFNSDSRIIAGGNLLVQTEKDGLHNEQTFGEKKVFSENGKLHNYWREKHKGRDSTGHSEQNYTLPEEITRNISLGSFAYESHRKALSHHAPSQGTELPQSNGISLPYTSNSFTPLPGSSLYIINPANKGYLVETDPRFANYRQWLGSDYMLDSLKLDPNNLHKRLGDGYYEQRLINEQIAELTGHRRLDGYQNDEEQFKALMDNGATAARSMNLSVGIALSAEQVAQLTSDIVWLVQKEVKLPDGGTQTVLVPQVYVRVKNGDIDGKGALLSGSNTQINVSGSLKNSGTIAGRNALIINTDTLDNIGGRIHAQKSAVTATQDINNIGGILSAEQTLLLNAGNNINSQSTAASSQNTQGSSTYLDRIAGIYITGTEKGVLAAQAGKDINIIASQISNQSEQGQTQLQAGRNINLDTVQTGKHQATHFDADNHVIRGSTNEVGSSIQTKGDVALLSGNNLNAKAAEVGSANGTLAVSAKNDINISAGINTTHVDDASKHKGRSGGGNKLVITDKAQSHNETAQSSTFDGKQVVLQAGNDANIKGSNVISDNGTHIQAGNHVHIGTTLTHNQSETYHQTKKSGLMSAGIGFTIGSKTNTQENQSQSNEHTGSTVGSLKGDTTIVAGKHYEQIGSTVSSPEGNNTIHAQSIDIQAAHNQLNSNTSQTYEQKGLTVAFSSPVTDLAQQAIAVAQSGKQVGQSKNGRVNAMAAANAGWQAYQTGKSAQNLANGTTNAKQVSISITYGEQQNRQTTQVQANQAQASQIQAGGKTTLIATGAAEQSNINIAGSDIAGKAGTILIADNDITLQSAEQSNTERSQNKSSGWNAGAAVSFGQGGWSLGVTAGGNVGKGHGNGDSITHRHSHIGDKGSQTLIQSGGDTTIKGAQVRGKGVQVHAKNLSIQSVQDRETYQSKQQNASAQVTVGYGFSASGDYSQSKIRADHASVTEQSGIYAGEDGYQIKVRDNTDLKGGIITSSQSAEDKGKNLFQTATLTASDIQNHSQYKGESFGLGASVAVSGKTLGQGAQNKPQNKHLTSVADKNGASSSVGYGSDQDSQSSITKSGINTQNIQITDEAAQIRLTGKTAAQTKADIGTNVTTDTAERHSGSLKNTFNKEAVQSELDLQREVTQEFDKTRQGVKQELYAVVDSKRTQATQERLKNGGYDNDKSRALNKEANELDEKIRWLDAGLGFVWGAGSSDMAWSMFATTQADRAVRSATAPKEMWFHKKIIDEKTGKVSFDTRQIWSLNDLSKEELASIQDTNGKVITVSNPGIFNNREDSLSNAAKQNRNSTNGSGVIAVMNPPTGKYKSDSNNKIKDFLWLGSSLVSELMYVGYDQLNNKVFQGYLPKTNSEKLNQDIYREVQKMGNGWSVDTSNHSRGGITASVSLKDWVNNQKQNGIAPIRKARFYGTATNVKNDYADVLQKNGYTYTGADGKTYNSGAYSIVHDKDFVGNKWIPFLLGNNETTKGACKGFCYSHSSYFAEVPEQYQRDRNGEYILDKNNNKIETEDWKDYKGKWGVPKMGDDGKYINHAIPKLVYPNKLNGEQYEENPF